MNRAQRTRLDSIEKSLRKIYLFARAEGKDLDHPKLQNMNDYELTILFAGLLLENQLMKEGKPSAMSYAPNVPNLTLVDNRSEDEKFDDPELGQTKKPTVH